MTRRGLTLVELLLVMAIISSLIAISIPALVSVRDHAQGAVCSQNVKTLSLAWLIYKDYNYDRIVGGMAGDKRGDWVHLPAKDSQNMTDAEKKGIEEGALYRYTPDSVDIYRCPADSRPPDPTRATHRSYSIAGGANGEGWQDTYVPLERYSQITKPSLTYIFVEEADPTGTNRGSWVMNPKTKSWVDPLAVRHNGDRSTLGFADGHVSLHRWVDASTLEMSKKQEFFFPVPENEGRDLQYMLEGFPQRPATEGGAGTGTMSP